MNLSLATPEFKNQVMAAFGLDMFDPNQVDIQDTPLFDSISVAAGSAANENTTSFFTNVQASSGKTSADTNAPRNGELPNNNYYSVQSVGLYIVGAILKADFDALMLNMAWEFKYGDRTVLQGPIWNWPAGAGGALITTAATTTYVLNGVPSRETSVALSIPIVIQPGINYSCRLTGTSTTMTVSGSGGLGLKMYTIFRGFWAKQI